MSSAEGIFCPQASQMCCDSNPTRKTFNWVAGCRNLGEKIGDWQFLAEPPKIYFGHAPTCWIVALDWFSKEPEIKFDSIRQLIKDMNLVPERLYQD